MAKKRKQSDSKPQIPHKVQEHQQPAGYEEEEDEYEYEEVVEEEEEEEEDDDDDEEDEEEEEEDEDDEEDDDDGEPAPAENKGEEIEDPKDRDAMRELLEPFGKDQLIEILKEAAMRCPSVASMISDPDSSDPIHCKIFVHGLAWDATTEDLAAAFSKYGAIAECKAVMDATGRCKGYGFVLFASRSGARKALKVPQKTIGSRSASCQLAFIGTAGNQPKPGMSSRMLFVSNVKDDANPERLRAFFARFGEIEDLPLGNDFVTKKFKGFAMFTYKTEEGCKRALEVPRKVFEGYELVCQKATEGGNPKPSAYPSAAPATGALHPNEVPSTFPQQLLMGMSRPAGFGLNMMDPAGAGLLGHGAGVGLHSPSIAMAPPSTSRAGLPPGGVGLGVGGEPPGLNSISPSVIDSYAQSIHRLGAYSGQLPSASGVRSQPGRGLGSGLPTHYYGR